MEKLKLTITNNGCNPIKVFGRPCIDIPAQGPVTTFRPVTSQTTALIERLRRQYPSLVITTKEEPLPPSLPPSGRGLGIHQSIFHQSDRQSPHPVYAHRKGQSGTGCIAQ